MEYTNCKWCGSTIFAGVARCSSCGKDPAGVVLAADVQAETAPSVDQAASAAAPVPTDKGADLGIKFLMFAVAAIAVALLSWKIYTTFMQVATPQLSSESAVSVLVKELNSPDKKKRYQACQALSGKENPPAENLAVIVGLLKDPEEIVRGSCGAAIGSYGAAASEAIPLLVSMLHDPSSYARMTAAESLGKIAAKVPEETLAAPALAEAMKDKDEQVRRFAAVGLQAMGDRAAPAIPALLVALNNHSAKDLAGDRQQIVQTLGALVSKSPEVVPALTRAARDPSREVQSSAIQALGGSGRLARPAIAVLGQMIHDKDEGIRGAAVDALGKCCADSDEVVPIMIEALNDRVDDVRKFAVLHLGEIGPKAKAAVPALIPILSDKAIYLRQWTAETLGNIGSGAKAALPRLRQMQSEKIVSNESEAGQLPETLQIAIQKIEK